ncbi:MAG TPA: hypothetical protein VLQ29_04980 [Candidatus Dormibacteraeota bacterium]|nr:hypothetical protein [Candidatus Dormibacteraeota bacterium]
MITATYQPFLPDRKNFGIKPPDFGLKRAAGIIEALTATADLNLTSPRREDGHPS